MLAFCLKYNLHTFSKRMVSVKYEASLAAQVNSIFEQKLIVRELTLTNMTASRQS